MSRSIFILLLLCTISYAFAGIRILESSESTILLEYKLDPYNIEVEGDYTVISSATMGYQDVVGAPRIPFEEIKIGIPLGASIDINIISSRSEKHVLNARLSPVPDVISTELGSAWVFAIDESLYRLPSSPLASALNLMSFRGYTHIPIKLSPFVYNGNRELLVTAQALIRIQINGNTATRSNPPSDELANLFLEQVINPEYAKGWHSDFRDQIHYADFSKSDYWMRIETDQDGMYKLSSSQLSSLPLSDINPQDFRIFSTGGALISSTIVEPGKEFTEIPITVVGEEDGRFDSSDYIVFYGTNRNGLDKNAVIKTRHYVNPYSHNAVYWLTFGQDFAGNPKRIQSLSEPASYDSLQSSQYQSMWVEEENHRRDITGYDWFMTKYYGQTTADYQLQFTLEDVDSSKDQSIVIALIQESLTASTLHQISLYVNEQPVFAIPDSIQNFIWSGPSEYIINGKHRAFVSGLNTIRIRVNRTNTDNLLINYYSVNYFKNNIKRAQQYPVGITPTSYFKNVRYNFSGNSQNNKVYRIKGWSDISLLNVNSISGGFYFIGNGIADTKFIVSDHTELLSPVLIERVYPTDLLNPISQIDNIIVTPEQFLSQAESLAELYWQYYQIRSKVVKQDDIFTQFNGGHPDPGAIKQFVRYVYQHFSSPKLSTMTLLGIGSIDWRNFSRQAAEKNQIIVYQKGSTTFTTSDDYFGMISSPSYPEIAIGRYPVKNTSELNNMLSNFRNYHENPSPGFWRNTLTLAADDLYNGSQTNPETIHTRQVQWTANALNRGILVDKIMAINYDYDEFQNKPKVRDDIFKSINDGTLMFYYIGHGSYDKLGAEDFMNGATDMNRFQNQGKLPLFVASSCEVGHFDHWGYESLAQKLVIQNNFGAIAAYAATRLSWGDQNYNLMVRTFNQALNNRNPFGYSTIIAKQGYSQYSSNNEKYVLFGDPHLRINPPPRDSTMTVSVDGETAKLLRSRQVAKLSGSFSEQSLNGNAEIHVYDSDVIENTFSGTNITHRGADIFRGTATVNNATFMSSFIIPDDVITGNSASTINYIWDSATKKDYVNYSFPISISDDAINVVNEDDPLIQLFVGSMDFRAGDTVSNNTTLYAKLSDANGINLTGTPGHNILLLMDDGVQPTSVTDYFSYDLDSYTQGTLIYPLADLKEGYHTLQLIAFDNLNRPSVANTHFIVKKSGELSLERLLPYPNPMKKDAYITFILSQDAEVNIGIHTVSGKRIRTIKTQGKQGFNQIFWDGRDGDGDRIANNTYFVRVKATNASKKSVEKTEKIVVYQ